LPTRNTQTFLEDFVRSAEAITHFLKDQTLDSYRANLMIRSAVERQLQILTEAVFRLGDDAARLCPTIDWRAMRGLGNFIRHEYDDVDDAIIWDAIHQDLPPAISAVNVALAKSTP
jgi:uncharacterized protein with HEPN domain